MRWRDLGLLLATGWLTLSFRSPGLGYHQGTSKHPRSGGWSRGQGEARVPG